jgi:RNA polymerase sigma-70 factor (ECF subfamily)
MDAIELQDFPAKGRFSRSLTAVGGLRITGTLQSRMAPRVARMNASAPALMDLYAREDVRVQDPVRVLEDHRLPLRSFLRKRLRNEEDIDDAVQEISLRLFSYQVRHAIESPTALLYHVAERVLVDFSRRAQSHCVGAHCALDDVQLLSEDPSPEQLASAGQDLALLIHALECLSSKCQDVFLLSRMEGLSYPQIAARCGISVKMVEKYISRALAELRGRVGGRLGAAT